MPLSCHAGMLPPFCKRGLRFLANYKIQPTVFLRMAVWLLQQLSSMNFEVLLSVFEIENYEKQRKIFHF